MRQPFQCKHTEQLREGSQLGFTWAHCLHLTQLDRLFYTGSQRTLSQDCREHGREEPGGESWMGSFIGDGRKLHLNKKHVEKPVYKSTKDPKKRTRQGHVHLKTRFLTTTTQHSITQNKDHPKLFFRDKKLAWNFQ